PTLQRFISEDPIGFRGGNVDVYAYVLNNPQKHGDALGLDGAKDDCSYAGIGCTNGAPRLGGRKAPEDPGLSSVGPHGGNVMRRGGGAGQLARSGHPTQDACQPGT